MENSHYEDYRTDLILKEDLKFLFNMVDRLERAEQYIDSLNNSPNSGLKIVSESIKSIEK